MQLLQFTSTSFSVPLLWSASDASASLPRKIGFSNFFLNSDTVPGIVDRTNKQKMLSFQRLKKQ